MNGEERHTQGQEKIGLFGGSFNPIHYGHLRIAKKSVLIYELNQMIFIPSYQSPHKTKKDWVDPSLRFQMVERVIHYEKKYRCDPYEIQRKTLSYTIDTVRFFSSKYPQARLFWVMGYDQWLHFHEWKESKNILERIELIVCSRGGYQSKVQEGSFFQSRVHWILETNLKINSSKIRSKIKQGLSVKKDIPDVVMTWIKKYRLYGYEKPFS